MQEILLSAVGKKSLRNKGILLHFDEVPYVDQAGNPVSSTLIQSVTGKFDKGIRPNNSVDSMVIVETNNLKLRSAFTMEMWVKRASGVSFPSNQYLALLYSNVLGKGIGLQYFSNTFYIYDTTGANIWKGAAGSLSSETNWIHLAICYRFQSSNRGIYEFYVSGQMRSQVVGENLLPETGNLNTYIGNHVSINVPAYGIDFDEFKLTPEVAKYKGNFIPPTEPFTI